MRVELDYVQGATVRQNANGIEVVRRARISELAGPKVLRQREALDAVGLPRYGDRHPAWGDLRVVEIDLTSLDVGQFEAQITYRYPSPTELAHMESVGTVIDRQWFAVTVTEAKTTDINGDALRNFYYGDPLTPNISAGRLRLTKLFGQLAIKADNAEIQRPSIGARVTMSEADSIAPLLTQGFGQGGINLGRWSGYPPKTWLVGGMDSQWERDRWVNTYELFYKPDTWQFRSTVEWYGAPPSDATVGNGIQIFDVYPTVNFNQLPFTL